MSCALIQIALAGPGRRRVRAAIDEHGFILGLDDEFWFDQGGYLRTHGVVVTDLTCAMLPGPYIIPTYRSVGHVRLTNKTPCGTYPVQFGTAMASASERS